MKTKIPYQTDISVVADVDVLVIGGGPAGIGAAVAAARAGARTALVERYGFLGGNATAGLVGPFMTSYSFDGKQQLVRGVFDELVRRMEVFGGAVHPGNIEGGSSYSGYYINGHSNVTPFDPEGVKLVAAEMADESGVRMFLHSFFMDTLLEDGRVAGAIILNKSGLQAIRAHTTIDCSADGDVAYKAGAEMEVGRESDGKMQPMTMFFRIGGVDEQEVQRYVDEHPEERTCMFNSLIEEMMKTREWPVNKNHLSVYRSTQPGVYRVNTTRIQGVDGTDVEDLTRAELEGRRQAFKLVEIARKRFPGFANAALIDTAAQIGVRETRRIVGEYKLTYEDLKTGRSFPDTIALYGYFIDIHNPTGATTDTYNTANIYHLPYRILVPIEVDGLLVAGRCVAATHEAFGAIRVMPCAFALGQAAGASAALASRKKIEPRQVEINELLALLHEQDVVLPSNYEVSSN